MKNFNLYYKGEKINNRPLIESEIDNIKQYKVIYKKNPISNKLEKISVDKIKIIKTTII